MKFKIPLFFVLITAEFKIAPVRQETSWLDGGIFSPFHQSPA